MAISSAHGLLVVDKPEGMTSARVVGMVKRALGVKKIGHTGTLDPMATGVLPLCIGEGTKIAGYLLASDKGYEGEFLLGVETDTLDREGQVLREDREAATRVTRKELEAHLPALRGTIQQVPPMFSALKKEGKRLHELARKGQVIERPARTLEIHVFDILEFHEGEGRGRFRVHASKGTYVRSLVDDLGRALGCGAHLTALRRTLAGQFSIAQAYSLQEIVERGADLPLIDPAVALAHLPAQRVPEALVKDVTDGKRLPWRLLSEEAEPDSAFALQTPDGLHLLAIAELSEERLKYRRVFNYALTKHD